MSIVANRYAEAMFSLSVEEDIVEQSYQSMKFIYSSLLSNQDLMEVLNHPQIELSEKIVVIKDIFGECEKNVLNFLLVMIEKSRINEFNVTFNEFQELYYIHNNIVIAEVKTAVLLNKEQEVKLEQNLSAKLNKNVKVNNIVDESIMGGMIIKVNNLIYDASIQSKIESLKSDLHDIQLD